MAIARISRPNFSGVLSSRRLRLVLAVFSGGLLVFAFAPFNLYPLAPVALALWWSLLRGQAPRDAAQLGYAFGVGFFAVGVSWVFNSLLIFGQAPWLVASALTAAFVAYLALYPALLAWVASRLQQRLGAGWRWWGFLAAGWVLLEAWRGWFLSGFPWLLIGHTLLETPLSPWLPLGGEMGAGLVVAGLAAGLAALVLNAGRERWVWVGGLALVFILTGVLSTRSWVAPSGSPLTVGMVQGNISQERKWAADGIEHSLEVYTQASARLSGVDVLVWPETALPAFDFEVAETLYPYAQALSTDGTELVTGIFSYALRERVMHNTVWHLPSDQHYHKRQLVPFGEYLPLRQHLGWLEGLLEIPMSDLTPGRGEGRMAMAGQIAGVSICYEAAYARHLRAALPEATFFLNVSNDAWFGRSLAPHQHLQIARVRALELGRPLVRATNTGISALIDHQGRVVERSEWFVDATLQGEIQPQQGLTPAARWGRWPAVLLAVLLILGLVVTGRNRSVTL